MKSADQYEGRAERALAKRDALRSDDKARSELLAAAQVFATLAQAAATEELRETMEDTGWLTRRT